jgi:ribonucleoside-diphosphate reductase alpha chain
VARRHREFLELRDNTGDEASRTHNLNIANWIAICSCGASRRRDWSLFDPKRVPALPDLYGDAFERAYEAPRRRASREDRQGARPLRRG